jgi:serine/threonine protein kinase
MVALACPGCGASLNVADDYLQRAEKCPRCGKPLPAQADIAPTLTAVEQSAQEATVGQQPAPSTGVPEDQAELASFLAPAEGPGEIGRLGGYRVLRVLGTGAMGVVFEAEDVNLKRRVALKAMLPSLAVSATSRQRFLREARTAAEVESDHVVTIYQVGEERNVPFIAMQFLKGETLDDRLHRGQLSMSEVLRIGREMALGLAAAHARGLVHRDIKPSNTWLETQTAAPQSAGRVKILDFGLARGVTEDINLTRQGTIVGTPSYMSPEQARGIPATAQSDLFSLGTVLYRMSTGTLPFKGVDTISTLLAVGTENPVPPRQVNAQIPLGLEALILRLLAKDPAERPASASEVADALRRIETDGTFVLDPAVSSSAVTEPTQLMPAPRAGRSLFVLITSLAILLGLGAFLATRILGLPRSANSNQQNGLAATGDGSALDALRPENVPAEDRVAGLEHDLVAVLGQRGAAPILQLAFSPDGPLLAGAGREADGHIWDVAGQQQAAIPCRRIMFTADGKSVVTAGPEGIGVWDVSGRQLWSIAKKKGEDLHAVDVAAGILLSGGSRSGTGLLKKKSARTDGVVRLWSLETRKEIAELPGTFEPVYAVKLSADGKFAAAMTADRTAHLWDVSTRKERKIEHAKAAALGAAVLQPGRSAPIAFSPDGKSFAISRRGMAYLVDVQSGDTQTTLRDFGGFVHSIAFSPSGTQVLTVDVRGVVTLFETSGKKVRDWSLPGLSNDAVFAPDGRHIAVAGSNGTVYILRILPPQS